MRASLIALALLLGLAAPAAAQDLTDCIGGGGNMEAMECILVAYEKADAELDAVWTKVLASVRPEGSMTADEVRIWKEDLLESQRGWIIFKENDCDAVTYEWYGGTGANFAVVDCLYRHTVARTRDLEDRYLTN